MVFFSDLKSPHQFHVISFESYIRPLSKLALLVKIGDFCEDLSANFEDISKDMAKKLDIKDAKKGWFNKQMEF